ncbi:MAG: DUF3291 domain-containing protein [Woeseiaceae bacterium]
MNFHLAQVNIAIARYTREDPLSANDDAEATFGEPDPIFNMSLWETKEALSDFAYKSDHVDVLRKARRRVRSAEQADTGTVVAECRHDSDKIGSARYRLDLLAQSGPTQDAFTFGSFFEAPAQKEAARG